MRALAPEPLSSWLTPFASPSWQTTAMASPSGSFSLPSHSHPTPSTHRLPSIHSLASNYRRASALDIPPFRPPSEGGPPRRLSTGGFPSVFALPGAEPVEGLGIRGADDDSAPAPPASAQSSTRKRRSDPQGYATDERVNPCSFLPLLCLRRSSHTRERRTDSLPSSANHPPPPSLPTRANLPATRPIAPNDHAQPVHRSTRSPRPPPLSSRLRRALLSPLPPRRTRTLSLRPLG